jgi:hypothetical protein
MVDVQCMEFCECKDELVVWFFFSSCSSSPFRLAGLYCVWIVQLARSESSCLCRGSGTRERLAIIDNSRRWIEYLVDLSLPPGWPSRNRGGSISGSDQRLPYPNLPARYLTYLASSLGNAAIVEFSLLNDELKILSPNSGHS